jgi:hypothetical protein
MFDGVSSSLTAAPSVLVAEGRIAAIHGPGEPHPAGVQVIDLPGLTLMPGLIDAHVHLCFDARRYGPGRARSALPSKPRRTGRSGALAALVPVVSLGAGDHAVCAASPAFCPWLATCTDRFADTGAAFPER